MGGLPVDMMLIAVAIIAIAGCRGKLHELLHPDDDE